MSKPLLESAPLPDFGAIQAEHIEPAVTEVIETSRTRIAALKAESATGDFDATVLPLEALHEEMHRVWSPVSHLYGVMNTPELREAYNRCLAKVTGYQTELAQDKALYELYARAAGRLDGNGARRQLVDHALRDFRLAGVDLPDGPKACFKTIMETLSEVQAAFQQNVLDAMADWSCHIDDESRVAGIPDAILARAAERATESGKTGWLFSLDLPTYAGVVSNADDRALRESFYEAWTTCASDQGPSAGTFDNTANIARILELRHEAARIVGFANFAEYSLATKMASTPDSGLAHLGFRCVRSGAGPTEGGGSKGR